MKSIELPSQPGIYRFYDEKDRLIYVGKAKNLRRRLAQYRNAKRCKAQIKMRRIYRDAKRLDFEVCESEYHACIQETLWIQNHRPKWNVAGAFSFLYPMIGLASEGGELYLCYTTTPENFSRFTFYGAFRSREWTGDGFFALSFLLGHIGHAIPRKHLVKQGVIPRSKARGFVVGFRQIPAGWAALFGAFLRGESFKAMEELSVALLDRPAAIAKADEVQEQLRTARLFWRHEAQKLRRAIARAGWKSYPVSQLERDLVFIAARAEVVLDRDIVDRRGPGVGALEEDNAGL